MGYDKERNEKKNYGCRTWADSAGLSTKKNRPTQTTAPKKEEGGFRRTTSEGGGYKKIPPISPTYKSSRCAGKVH